MKYPSRAAQYVEADDYSRRVKSHNQDATRNAWMAGYAKALQDRAAVDRVSAGKR